MRPKTRHSAWLDDLSLMTTFSCNQISINYYSGVKYTTYNRELSKTDSLISVDLTATFYHALSVRAALPLPVMYIGLTLKLKVERFH